MQKETREQIVRDKITHTFYCDMCGEEIGTSTEYEDGYYQKLGEYSEKIFVTHTWYELKKCLCNHCAEKQDKIIVTCLKDLGFVED